MLALLAACILVVPDGARAQSAADILARTVERHEARLVGVEDVTIRQETMGMSTTVHLVKEMVDGRPTLRVQEVDAGALPVDPTDDLMGLWADPWAFEGEWADRWRLEGSGSVGGEATWRMELTDFQGVDWDQEGLADASFEPRRLVMDLHQRELVPLEMTVEGDVVEGGDPRPVRMHLRFSDYREVDGYLHPFHTVMETDLTEAGISPEEIAQAREALAALRSQMEGLPEGQRQAMEEMMGEQIEALERMVEGDGLSMEIRVTDLRVNEGPPSPGAR